MNQKVRGVIEAGGGTLLKVDNWGKRKLAYEVKKQLKGIYLFFSYLGTAGLVEEVERNLRLTDSVIRYYSVKIAENVDPAARTTELTDESFAKAATPGPDEEEIATGQAEVALAVRRRRRARSTSKRPCSAASTSPAAAAEGRVSHGTHGRSRRQRASAADAGGDDKKRPVGRRKQCKFCADEAIKIDYKDASLLKYFITDRGKLVPRRLTGNCAKHQRAIAVAVNRARMIALMPFAVTGA